MAVFATESNVKAGGSKSLNHLLTAGSSPGGRSDGTQDACDPPARMRPLPVMRALSGMRALLGAFVKFSSLNKTTGRW